MRRTTPRAIPANEFLLGSISRGGASSATSGGSAARSAASSSAPTPAAQEDGGICMARTTTLRCADSYFSVTTACVKDLTESGPHTWRTAPTNAASTVGRAPSFAAALRTKPPRKAWPV